MGATLLFGTRPPICSRNARPNSRRPVGSMQPGRKLQSAQKVRLADAQYTCPMHPEIIRDAPRCLPDLRMGAGTMVSFGLRPSEELADLPPYVDFSAGAGSALMFLTMGGVVGDCRDLRDWIGPSRWASLPLSLCWPRPSLCFGQQLPFFKRELDVGPRERSPNMWDTSSVFGVWCGCLLYSIFATFLAGRCRETISHCGHGAAQYFEAGELVIIALGICGQVLELRAREQHRRRDSARSRSRAQ